MRARVMPARRDRANLELIVWSTVRWRKVGDAGRIKLNFGAKMLKSLALPRGLEPLFSP